MDETITSFADRIIGLAERVIIDGGGARIVEEGQVTYRIKSQEPACVHELFDRRTLDIARLSRDVLFLDEGQPRRLLSSEDAVTRARTVYMSICSGIAEECEERAPDAWKKAVESLAEFENVVQAIYYHADVPAGAALREKATAAGLEKPAERKDLW